MLPIIKNNIIAQVNMERDKIINSKTKNINTSSTKIIIASVKHRLALSVHNGNPLNKQIIQKNKQSLSLAGHNIQKINLIILVYLCSSNAAIQWLFVISLVY